MSSKTRLALAAGIALAIVAGGLLAWLSLGDSRAKEGGGKKAKGGGAVPVAVSPAVQQPSAVRLQAIGNVEAFSTVAVKARVDGEIVAVNFKEGQEVRRGDVLFRIDPRPYEATLKQAEANALRDAAARDQARSQERRYKELLEKNFVSKEAYAQIATNAQTAEATAKASQAALENARLNREYCTISAPIDGVAGKVLLQVGNLVKANDVNALVVLNQVRPVYVNFAVPEQTLPGLRKHMGAGPLSVEVMLSGETKPVTEGRLIFIDNAVDPSTGTIRLRGQFDNKDNGLWPGQFVNVSVRLYEEANAILVPARALQTGPNGQYVYVIREDMTAEMRLVTAERNEGDAAVVRGLKQGERVVVGGALRLSPGARVEVRTGEEAEKGGAKKGEKGGKSEKSEKGTS
jgi:multidrug efflux system membrane fusion protein